jgi:hypothetical protein
MIKHSKPISAIVLHHSATTFTPEDNFFKKVEAITRYHKETRGWGDIGYHYVIDPYTGTVAVGRDTELRGSHARGRNNGTIGICMLGKWIEGNVPIKGVLSAHYLYMLHSSLEGKPLEVWCHFDIPGGLTKTSCGTGAIADFVDGMRVMRGRLLANG